MIRLFKWLFGMCDHKWVIIDQSPMTKIGTGACVGVLYVLQCEKCGSLEDKWVY